MSDLIDRYLMAVSANLPEKERDDITAELRDVLYSKAEAREEQLGRPMTKAEVDALLHEFGHPLEVAGRYLKNQYLIGPTVYPFYIFYLKATLGIIAAIYIGLLFLSLVGGEMTPRPDADIFEALLIAFAAVTLTFMIIERTGAAAKITPNWPTGMIIERSSAAAKMATNWKLAQLPMMGAPTGRPRSEILFEIAAGVVATLWWIGVIHFPSPTPGHMSLSMAPVWMSLFWPILALLVVQIGLDVFEVVMPGLVRIHAVNRIVFHLALVVVMGVILQAGHWIDVTEITNKPGLQETLERNFNRGFKIGFWFAIFCAAYEIWRSTRRVMKFNKMKQMKLA